MTRPEQTEMDIKGKGVQPVRIAAVERLVKRYVNTKDEYETAKATLDDIVGEIAEAMEKHELTVYKSASYDITLKHGKTSIKVKSRGKAEDTTAEAMVN